MAGGWTGEYLTDEEVWWKGIQYLADSKFWHGAAQTELHNFMPHIGLVLGNWLTEPQLESYGAGQLSKLYLSQSPFNILVDFDAKKHLMLEADSTAAKSRLTKTKAVFISENGSVLYPAKIEDLQPWAMRALGGRKS